MMLYFFTRLAVPMMKDFWLLYINVYYQCEDRKTLPIIHGKICVVIKVILHFPTVTKQNEILKAVGHV